jgi:alpha-tubulin suppressor-like RCC1 family protein
MNSTFFSRVLAVALGAARALCGAAACVGAFSAISAISAIGAANARPLMMDETVSQFAHGHYYACGLRTNGSAACWGVAPFGPSSGTVRTPTDIVGLSSGITRLSMGVLFGCAVTSSNTVKCWDSSSLPDLLIEAPFNGSTFASLLGGDVVDVFADGAFACALKLNGKLRCVGTNVATVELGLPDGEHVVEAAASNSFGCARTTTGAVYCWGNNGKGQLGDTTTTDSATPVRVQLPLGFIATSVATTTAGFATDGTACAASTAGRTMCWGNNVNGALGGGTADASAHSAPGDVLGLSSGTRKLSMRHKFGNNTSTCASDEFGGIKCWGSNAVATLGNGQSGTTIPFAATPAYVVGLSSGANVVASAKSLTGMECAQMLHGDVKCWGTAGVVGGVGDGTSTARYTPVSVNRFSRGASMVTAGTFNTCAITSGGGAKCWGASYNGQVGAGAGLQGDVLLPTNVTGLTQQASQISAGSNHSCAVTFAGGVKCWGRNSYGALGLGAAGTPDGIYNVPTDVPTLTSGVRRVQVTAQQGCALLSNNTEVRCWGTNVAGLLGVDPAVTPSSNVPFTTSVNLGLDAGETVLDIVASAGNNDETVASVCALTSSNRLRCWGSNRFGQLGIGSTANAVWQAVTPIGFESGVTAVALGLGHTCAIKTGGSLFCWGSEYSGVLGNGYATGQLNTPSTTPVNLGLGVTATAIAAGGLNTCAVLSSGKAACWGANDWGQVGDGTQLDRSAPALVSLADSARPVSITIGLWHVCALTSDTDLQCWGRNQSGQLGNKSNGGYQPSPVEVLPLGQSLKFTAPLSLKMNVATPLSATASSGLPVSFDTWTPQTCTVSGNTTTGFTVTAIAPVLCGIRASQPGNLATPAGQFTSAPQAMEIVPISDVACGSANGVFVSAAPTANLCSGGTTSAVTSGNGYEWFCNGATTHAAAVCRAPFAVATVTLQSASSTVAVGQAVLLTATVTGNGGAATGTMEFFDIDADGDAITGCAARPIIGGVATCNAIFTYAGDHRLQATYSGSATYSRVISSQIVQTVTRGASALILTSASNPSVVGASVMFTATPTPAAANRAGTVTFSLGGNTIAGCIAKPLVSGSATCTPLFAATGSYSMAASYSGDANFEAATSSTLLQAVNALPGAPQLVVATAAAPSQIGQVSVAFAAPASNGGSAILSYTATCSRLAPAALLPVSASGTASPIVVTPLTLGVAVNCVVTATNGVGTGPASAASNTATPVVPLNVDASTATVYDAATDGVMIVRALLGLTGAAISNGARGTTATRDAAQIATYLAALRPQLDIDGNGQIDALTDGLLIVRYMLNLRGTALTAGAVGPMPGRTLAEIEAYLATLMP